MNKKILCFAFLLFIGAVNLNNVTVAENDAVDVDDIKKVKFAVKCFMFGLESFDLNSLATPKDKE